MPEVEIVEYDPSWPERFVRLAGSLRRALGDRAARIDHIGSTSVPGLAAKDVIDVQVSVADLEPFATLHDAIAGVGYEWTPSNPDLRKRFFRIETADGVRMSNLHVRRLGEFSEQAALLFRDYLRARPAARRRYEEVKRSLATRSWPTVDHYAEAKGDCVWALLREADVWSWTIGWRAGPPDG